MIKHKFNAVRTVSNGISYASKKEAKYANELRLRKKAGEVLFFLEQVPIRLPGGTKLVVDFQEFHSDGSVHFVETKGFKTDVYKIKKREIEAYYPMIKIEEV